MKRLQHLQDIRGRGSLAGDGVEPIEVTYVLSIGRWMLTVDSSDGSGESPGTFSIKYEISYPGPLHALIMKLLAHDGNAELTLEDGTKAEILVANGGRFVAGARHGRIAGNVNALEGFT